MGTEQQRWFEEEELMDQDDMFTPPPFDSLLLRKDLSEGTRSFLNPFVNELVTKKHPEDMESETSDQSTPSFNYYKCLIMAAAQKKKKSCGDDEQVQDLDVLKSEASRALNWLLNFSTRVYLIEENDADFAIQMHAEGVIGIKFVVSQGGDRKVSKTLCSILVRARVPFICSWC